MSRRDSTGTWLAALRVGAGRGRAARFAASDVSALHKAPSACCVSAGAVPTPMSYMFAWDWCMGAGWCRLWPVGCSLTCCRCNRGTWHCAHRARFTVAQQSTPAWLLRLPCRARRVGAACTWWAVAQVRWPRVRYAVPGRARTVSLAVSLPATRRCADPGGPRGRTPLVLAPPRCYPNQLNALAGAVVCSLGRAAPLRRL